MVAAVLKLKHEILHNRASVKERVYGDKESEFQDTAAEEVCSSLLEASLSAWVMKGI